MWSSWTAAVLVLLAAAGPAIVEAQPVGSRHEMALPESGELEAPPTVEPNPGRGSRSPDGGYEVSWRSSAPHACSASRAAGDMDREGLVDGSMAAGNHEAA